MKWKWCLSFFFFWGTIHAQKSLELAPFDVIDSTEIGLQSSFHVVFDSLNAAPIQSLNLVDYLTTRSSLNFKNLGPGLLATPTFRGGDANHTQLLWNGLSINSPMLGTIDFSTIPISQFSSIGIVTGNSMNLYSAGGLGGGVLLNQSANYQDSYVQLSQNISSFENYSQSIRVNQNFKLFRMPASLSVNGDLQILSNRYPFIDISAHPYDTLIMQDAALEGKNISPMLSFMPSKMLNVSLIYWYNETDRNIPSPINSAPTVAHQSDVVHRSMAIIDFIPNKKFNLSYRTMLEDNVNAYSDSTVNISNSNNFQAIHNQADITWILNKKLKIRSQVNQTHIDAQSENYIQNEVGNSLNAMINAELHFLHDRFLVELGSRYASFNDNNSVLPFGGVTFKPVTTVPITLSASASQSARFPTLNEMYWQPVGNALLRAERGNLMEIGLNYQTRTFIARASGFMGDYTNRIRWLPNGGIFSPINVDYSISQGIDIYLEKAVLIQNHSLKLTGSGQFIDARGGSSKKNTKKLSYIPQLSLNTGLEYRLKTLRFNALYQFMDKRFIANDESAYMPSYHLTSVSGSYLLSCSKHAIIELIAAIDNLLDWQYQNMPWRPMPGRMYTLQINLTWKR